MRVYFGGVTPYQLLLFLLIIKGKEIEKKYIFPESFPKEILDNIQNKIVIKEEFLKYNNKILKGILFISYLLKISFSFHFGKLKEVKKSKVYGDGINIEFFVRRGIKTYLLEDGLKNYSIKNKQINRIERLLTKIFWRIRKNELKKIKKIYLTGLAPIPVEISKKVELIDLEKLWKEKKEKEKNEILRIFSFDISIKNNMKSKKIILFTQPLSEDGIITEEEKIEIYIKILKNYSAKEVIIKTHPREKTKYKEKNIFGSCLIIDSPIPFELFNLCEIKIERAVTLFSTAALSLGNEVKVDFYGTEVHKKILERFGSCDNIMRRNSFIKD